jgi:hypothetical protein
MRRTARTVAGAVLFGALAIAAAPAAAQPASVTLNLIENDADHVQIFPDQPGWIPGRTLVYWGKFTAQGAQPGSYRATCTWLADDYWPNSVEHKQDRRLSCTVVIAFKAPPAPAGASPREPSGLVLEGLVKRPTGDGELFARRGYHRELAITGGSGAYREARGRANIRHSWKIIFPDGLPPE